MRIDDLDTPRQVKGAADDIIRTLAAHGLQWDKSIYYQSQHLDSYSAVISGLLSQNKLYPCTCSRKSLKSARTYPQTCRSLHKNTNAPVSLRVKSNHQQISFCDQLQGDLRCDFAQDHGDFIVQRKDNITAYQLAVVIDDFKQNITHVVRGADLLDSTPKQLFLQQHLHYPSPNYCHIPIIIDAQGVKLSKQTHAQAISSECPSNTLYLLLGLLKQNPPASLKQTSVTEIIDWAINHWQVKSLTKIRTIN